MQNMWTQICLSVLWEVSKQLGHALRMSIMSKVKSMACINALFIVNYVIQGIREMTLSLTIKEKVKL